MLVLLPLVLKQICLKERKKASKTHSHNETAKYFHKIPICQYVLFKLSLFNYNLALVSQKLDKAVAEAHGLLAVDNAIHRRNLFQIKN